MKEVNFQNFSASSFETQSVLQNFFKSWKSIVLHVFAMTVNEI